GQDGCGRRDSARGRRLVAVDGVRGRAALARRRILPVGATATAVFAAWPVGTRTSLTRRVASRYHYTCASGCWRVVKWYHKGLWSLCSRFESWPANRI